MDEYERKRDFGATPEPRAEPRPVRGTGPPVFVIHRHEARRLHYDLRLEMEGALRSWAVPKGFSYDPRDKHLAVRTEDHPMEYEHFEGVIPKGEYGAGTMAIWDRGTFEPRGDAVEAVKSGEFKFILRGRKLRGEWHIVETQPKENLWLLFKARDRYAGGEKLRGIDMDLSTANAGGIPRAFRPMRPAETVPPYSDPAFVFEMEFAGRRAFAVKQGDRIGWRGLDRTVPKRVGAVAEALRELRADTCALDGVLVALDEHGRPSRAALDAALADGGEVFYYATDLLHFDGLDLRELPLLERKSILQAILPESETVLYVDHVLGSGEELAQAVSGAGLSGMIAKRARSPYRGGESTDWRRVDVEPDSVDVPFAEALSQTTIERAGNSVEYSNLDKVFWPVEGYTKGQLIGYYEQVADALVPHLVDRPVHMNRHPDGIEGQSFYQRQAPEHLPDWFEVLFVPDTSDGIPSHHMIASDKASLLYLINLGTIDLHPWMSRKGSLNSPDWMVIDLDPKEAPFQHVVRIARTAGKLLRGIGLTPYLKTSGSTGLHVYVPLIEGFDYDQSRTFGEIVARFLVREHKDIATVERVPGKRGGKVYVDFMQNRRGQTIVPPYSARPVPGATVSTPLMWDELESDLAIRNFDITNVPARLEKYGDLFEGAVLDKQDFRPALDLLVEQM